MIRMLRLASQVHTYWKNGVLLTKTNELLYIRLYPEKSLLVLIARGDAPGMR